MLKTLLILRLRAVLSILTGASRTKKKQSTGRLAAFAALMLLSFGSLGFLFWHIFDVLAKPFAMFGFGWIYFSLAALMALALMLVGGIFAAKSQLFEARDNALLLSLPIQPLDILLSRLFVLWLIAMLSGLPVLIPGLIVWPKPLPVSGIVILFALFLILLPFLCLSVSSFLGWLVHRIAARFGHKPVVTVLLWTLLLGGYFYISFRMNDILNNLSANPLALARMLGSLGPLLWPGRAVAFGDLKLFGKLALFIVPLFLLVCLLLARTFIRTATEQRGSAKKRYVEKTACAFSPRGALLMRELRHLWASPPYLFNSGMGVVMALLGAVVLAWKAPQLRNFLASRDTGFLQEMLQTIAIPAACFLSSMIFLTAPSISLEGKNLWISQSLPVDTREILRAKLRLQLVVALPPILLLSAVAAVVLQTRGVLLALQLVLPALYSVLIGLVGLLFNLRYPNMDWVNETQAVKTGMSVLFTMFIGMIAAALPVLGYILFDDVLTPKAVGLGAGALVLIACILLYRRLMTQGAKRFESL